MTALRVEIAQNGLPPVTLLPSAEPQAFAARETYVLVHGAKDARVLLDGSSIEPVLTGELRVFSVDLARSTGYHELRVLPGGSFWFATEDGKSKLEGAREMLRALGEAGLSWGNQLYFSSGEAVPNPHVEFAWVRRHGQRIAETLAAIARRPRTRAIKTPEVDAMARAPVDLARTFKVIRASFRDNLELRPAGPIHMSSGARYAPRVTVSRRPARIVDTPPNRRAAQLGLLTVALCERLMPLVSKEAAAELQALRALFGASLIHTSLAKVARLVRLRPLPLAPAREELLDPRYRFIYERYVELIQGLGWILSAPAAPLYSYVKYVDEIYQAFAALLIARGFDCAPTVPDLRPDHGKPSFSGSKYEVYYNTVLPVHLMQTWRQGTSRPDTPRPDIVIRHRADNRVVLLDAKYRRKGNRCSDDSLPDVQYYLNAFGLTRAGILYPPEDPSWREVSTVSARGFELTELPFGPWPDVEKHVTAVLRPAVDALFVKPSWSEASP